jgi:hypothetical protein
VRSRQVACALRRELADAAPQAAGTACWAPWATRRSCASPACLTPQAARHVCRCHRRSRLRLTWRPQIYAKAEFTNPGGSVKDRVAVRILQARPCYAADTQPRFLRFSAAQEALASGALRPGGLVTEGTAGSTGISLAMMAPAFGAQSAATCVRRALMPCFRP